MDNKLKPRRLIFVIVSQISHRLITNVMFLNTNSKSLVEELGKATLFDSESDAFNAIQKFQPKLKPPKKYLTYKWDLYNVDVKPQPVTKVKQKPADKVDA